MYGLQQNQFPLFNGLPHNPPQTPRFDVPPQMKPFMNTLVGFTLGVLQNAVTSAGQGQHPQTFWMAVVQNQFNNPAYFRLMQRTAAYAYYQLLQQPTVQNNVPAWLEKVAAEMTMHEGYAWLNENNPAAFNGMPPHEANTMRQCLSEYAGLVSQISPLWQQGVNQNYAAQQGGFGGGQQGGQWAMLGQQGGTMGNNGGWVGNNGGYNSTGGSFNSGAFNSQTNNNAYQTNGGGQWGTGWQPPAKGSGMNSGRKSTFDPVPEPGQEQWPSTGTYGGTQNQNDGPTYKSPGTGFKSVGVQDDTADIFAGQKPLNTLGGYNITPEPTVSNVTDPSNSNWVKPETVFSETGLRRIYGNIDRYMTRIPLPGGRIQRTTTFYNPNTHGSVYEIDDQNVIVNQIIFPIEDLEKYMNFEDHNTCKFLPARGHIDSLTELKSNTTLAQLASDTMNAKWLGTAIKQLEENNDVETLEGEELRTAIRKIVKNGLVNVDKVIDGVHEGVYEATQLHMVTKGVDCILDENAVVVDMIDLDYASLNESAEELFIKMKDERDVDRFQAGWNNLSKILGTRLWSRLDDRLVKWVNEELYANYGLKLYIESFAGDISELFTVLAKPEHGIDQDERDRFLTSIANKFMILYTKSNPAGETLNYEFAEDSDQALLGQVNRYLLLPLYNDELQISSDKASAAVTAESSPDLFKLCSTAFTNLTYPGSTQARSYIVTRNGDFLLVTRPAGMQQFLLTKQRPTVFLNPLAR